MITYHYHLANKGLTKEHYSTGGHCLWDETYVSNGYFGEHQHLLRMDEQKHKVWEWTRKQQKPPRQRV